MIESIFFCGLVSGSPQRGALREETYHSLNLLLVRALLQGILEVILRRNVGCIVLVNLLTARQRGASPPSAAAVGCTKLYALSKKVAMLLALQLHLLRVCAIPCRRVAMAPGHSSALNAIGVVYRRTATWKERRPPRRKSECGEK